MENIKNKIIELYLNGMSISDIEKRLNISIVFNGNINESSIYSGNFEVKEVLNG